MAQDDPNLETLRAGIDTLIRVFRIGEARQQPDGQARFNPSDVQSLLFLADHPNSIGTDLGTFLGVPPTTVSAIVDRLARRGLVRRDRTEANRRVVLLSLTPEGAKAVAAILAEQRAHCAAMLEALPQDQRAGFVANVAQIAAAIGR